MKHSQEFLLWRYDHNKSQKEMAKVLKCSEMTLSKYERGLTFTKKLDRKVELFLEQQKEKKNE